jgi:hypothetical protein
LVGAKRRDVISVFKFMKANLALNWIQTIVSTLDISRSGFYVWHGVIVARPLATVDLTDRAKTIHQAAGAASDQLEPL